MAKPKSAITPMREEDYSEWYQEVIKAADLAEKRCAGSWLYGD